MAGGSEDRAYWVKMMDRIVRPVLTALSKRQLKATMPVEVNPGNKLNRAAVTHLEALGRSLSGLSAWINLGADQSPEGKLRGELADLARQGIDAGTDPASADFMNFTKKGQYLVDAAFLSHAIVRAPGELWAKLGAGTKKNLVSALKATRAIVPGMNNWVMFSAMVEAALYCVGEQWEAAPVERGFSRLMQWYKGDGTYGDGTCFHWDYYNSFVMQPMLVDLVGTVGKEKPEWSGLREAILSRARRYAAILEKLISPEGTFPATGRSLAYRIGVFQLLGQMALRRDLPAHLAPGQVRCAVSAVIRKMMEAPGVFDEKGFLTIGFCGHQPGVGETYISTGSLYMATLGMLPLGLPATDEFWTCDAMDWSSRLAWSGAPMSPDHALNDKPVELDDE